jgi:putative two-component system response regulator
VTQTSSERRRILIVDDTPAIHDGFATILCGDSQSVPAVRKENAGGEQPSRRQVHTVYELDHAVQGRDALEKTQRAIVRGNAFDLAFVDMRMPPGWDGLTTIEELWGVDADLPIVLCTAWSDYSWQQIIARLGRSDQLLILKKPFDATEVAQMATTMTEKRHLQRMQEEYTKDLEKQVRSRTAALLRAHEESIHLLVRASVHRDTETGNHIKRVGLYSARLAMALGLDQSEVDSIRLAAPMHDVGKIGIPDKVLRKPGALTAEERRIMETHTTIGAELLSGSESPVLCKAKEIAEFHHERWDGRGYPHGIAGSEIPLAARIVAVADVYDALSQNRVYRAAMPEPQVLEILQQGRGTHFDPELVDVAMTLTCDFQLIAAVHPDEASGKLASNELLATLHEASDETQSASTEPEPSASR